MMGNCYHKNNRDGKQDAQGQEETLYANVAVGETPVNEDVLYSTIDHVDPANSRKTVEMRDNCDYAVVSLPSVKKRNSSNEDCNEDYVLMG
ncbi:uncharacterized protein si:ch211-214p13.7 [Polyodon spathula]|uniref:uncharacterized protein si:ch211-214p13.7 n=1 Tax=Polyodon spathula TaxID=7913 RepID=UPI001B7E40B2|nr:uncharacterized protein si:ch211-214p13.7 [Polyodon spathula]